MRAAWRLVALALVAGASSLASADSTMRGDEVVHFATRPKPWTGPATKDTVGPFSWQGCWTEATDGRALADDAMASDDMTLEACARFCNDFVFFGAEYGRECYCGNSLHEGSVRAKHQQDCSFLCAGDKSEYCGAGLRLQLYRQDTCTTSPLPISVPTSPFSSQPPPTSSLSVPPTGPIVWPGNAEFAFYSCVSEPSKGRLLATQMVNDGNSMTVELCLQACSSYAWAGVEYGRECWCGDSLNLAGSVGAIPARNVSQAECNIPCPGDGNVYCGAGLRISLYASREAAVAN
ncbi:hypothetical protein CDD81_6704 [Ophiocordyceps australis]|uniref:WSC domain-containing protein n=1 Tax=Ophiocordyceps australis TaxID=1399860 RepID=A0A2C5Y6F7_9HYPO|nr:hypothetical protein CDD81_6704 [Ophiocordyceps australis]